MSPRAADLLAKICGLLGSTHDGERAAAAAKASGLLKEAGLTWRDVLVAPASTPANDPEPAGAASPWPAVIEKLLRHPPYLHANERAFLNGVLQQTRRGRKPSDKQAAWVRRIMERAR